MSLHRSDGDVEHCSAAARGYTLTGALMRFARLMKY